MPHQARHLDVRLASSGDVVVLDAVAAPDVHPAVVAVVDTAGRPKAATVKLTLRFDSGYPTAYDAETRYSFAIVWRMGTGANAAFWIWQVSNCKLTAEPKLTNVGNRLYMDLELGALQDVLSREDFVQVLGHSLAVLVAGHGVLLSAWIRRSIARVNSSRATRRREYTVLSLQPVAAAISGALRCSTSASTNTSRRPGSSVARN